MMFTSSMSSNRFTVSVAKDSAAPRSAVGRVKAVLMTSENWATASWERSWKIAGTLPAGDFLDELFYFIGVAFESLDDVAKEF